MLVYLVSEENECAMHFVLCRKLDGDRKRGVVYLVKCSNLGRKRRQLGQRRRGKQWDEGSPSARSSWAALE